jgi:putative Holliday junction resolvase
MRKKGCCLGFDFGLRKIGVAVGQFITMSASPLVIISAKQGVPDWNDLQKIISKWQPDCLVVGFPMAIDGKELSITSYVKQFVTDLQRFKLPVYLTDERLTTKEARSNLFEQGGFRALAYGKADSMAAALILEQWLHEQDHS